jgi:DNA-binding transcriptional LysR family regulator
MIHLGRLRALCELSERGTIAAAAQALHLTPSAVSQQIAALERDVGERLVEPDGRKVRLTPVGRVLVSGADAVFAEVERLHAEVARHAEGTEANLRVGSFATGITRIVAPAAAILRDSAPGVRIEVVEAEAPDAFADLARHELDMVVSMEAPGAPPGDDPRATRIPLRADPLLALLPCDHPLAGRKHVPLAGLANDHWIAPPAGWLCEQIILAGCQTAGFTPHVLHRAGDWQAMVALCSAGLGVAMVPALADVRPDDAVVLRQIAEPAPRRHIFAACRRGAQRSPAIAALAGAMRTAAAEPADLVAVAA